MSRRIRASLLLCSLSLGLATTAIAAKPTPTPATAAASAKVLDAALAGAQRSDASKARDVYRHPRETLLFFGVQANSQVIEIAPGGGWYTEVLAPYLRDNGKLYEALIRSDAPEAQAFQQKSKARFEQKLAEQPAVYDRVVTGALHGEAFEGLDVSGKADFVLTFRNIHNWLEDGSIDAKLRAFAAALKPGGVLGVEEHRAPPGTSLDGMIKSGYVTEDYVIERAKAAGLTLAARSEINANPRDDKNHPNGVWSLPPTLRGGDTDKDRFLAIGESDRMTLRFVKAGPR